MSIFKVVIVVIAIITSGVLFLTRSRQETPKLSGPIVFFGNSITAGVGAGPDEDFPTLVGRKLGVQVINAGVSGDTTGDALARIDRDVIAKKPSIVVVEFGGNDFLQKVNFEVTRKNYEEIMLKLSETDAKIVIVSVRTSAFGDKYVEFEKDLAKKYKAIYVDNILKGIISDPKLMADSIHPNAAGYQKIAKRLIDILRPMYKDL